jgi:phage terminase Nu1 subunit (DNA packaging protein)
MKKVNWTLTNGAAEFSVSPDTLARGLKANGLSVGKGQTFSTKQIAAAIYGDLKVERVRLARARSEKLEMENKIRSGELVNLPVAERELWFNLYLPFKQALEVLPDQLAPLVNPENPKMARSALAAHVEKIKSQIREPKTKVKP